MASDGFKSSLPALAVMLVVACLVTTWPASSAVAQTGAKTPTEAEKETARSLMGAGREKEAAGDHQGALDAYEAADAIMGVPSTGLSVGLMRERLGKLVEARTVLLRVGRTELAAGAAPVLIKARDKATALADELATRIPSLRVVLAEGAVFEGKVVEGLEVAVDGQAVPAALLGHPQKLNPGEHRVTASLRGTLLFEQQVVLVERSSESVQVMVDPAALAKVPPAIVVDPGPADSPPAVVVDPGSDPGAQGSHAAGGVPAVAWVGFGVGAAGLIVTTVAGMVAISRTSELSDACPNDICTSAQQGLHDDAALAAHVSTIGFVTALVGAGVGVVALLTAGGDADHAEVTEVEPTIGPLGVGVRGRF